MAESTAFRNAHLDAVGPELDWFALCTADPGTTGLNVVTSRVQTTYDPAAAGSKVGSQVSIPVPAATTVTHWAAFSADNAGAFSKGGALPTPEIYGGTGTYDLTPTLTAP
jgi:hypothetical protein